jgi:hypothetical protein
VREVDRQRALRVAAPLMLGALFLAAWQAFVWLDAIPA